jgi:hypothetical protein
MAFTEDSGGGTFNNTSPVALATGNANGTILVKNIVICNIDLIAHTVYIEFVKNGAAYRMFSVTLASGDSLVQDFLVALVNANYTVRASLAGPANSYQPTFVTTWAQHS